MHDTVIACAAVTDCLQRCSHNSLCNRLGIPECILLVTQRVNKYPLLIEPIVKTTAVSNIGTFSFKFKNTFSPGTFFAADSSTFLSVIIRSFIAGQTDFSCLW
jgi:hypothetical protein